MRRLPARFVCAAVLAAAGLVPSSVLAADQQWTGGSTTDPTNFNLAANWTPVSGTGAGAVPGSGDLAAFYLNAPLPAPVRLTAATGTLDLGVYKGPLTLDLNGLGYALGGTLGVWDPASTPANSPVFTLTNTSATLATLNSDRLQVGNAGTLNLTGSNLTVVSNSEASIGLDTGASASAVLDGATWQVNGRLSVGASNSGSLVVQNGGKLVGPSLYSPYQMTIGALVGKTGSVSVTGAGSQVSSSRIIVGGAGTSSLSVSAGGTVSSDDYMFLGYNAGSSGSATVGAGGTLNAKSLVLGNGGSAGTLSIQGGTVETQYLTDYNGGVDFKSGTLTITTSGYRTRNDGFRVGDGTAAATLNLNGGFNLRNAAANAYTDLAVSSQAQVNLNNGSLTVGSITVDAGGSFHFNSGSLTLMNTGLTVNAGGLIGPSVTLGATGQRGLSISGTLTIDGADASVTVNRYGILSAAAIALTNGGSFTYNGGLLTLSSSTPVDIGATGLVRGPSASPEALTLGAGDNLSLGAANIQSGATLTVNGGTFSAGTLTNAGTLRYAGGSLSISSGNVILGAGGIIGSQATPETLPVGDGQSLQFYNSDTTIAAGQRVVLYDGARMVVKSLTRTGDGHVEFGPAGSAGGGRLIVQNGLTLDLAAGGSNPLGAASLPAGANVEVSNAALTISGGVFEVSAGRIVAPSLTRTAGGELHFGGTGKLGINNLKIGGADGIGGTDAAAPDTVTVGAGAVLASYSFSPGIYTDRTYYNGTANVPVTVGPGAKLVLAGGTLATGGIALSAAAGATPAGAFEWTSGELYWNGDFTLSATGDPFNGNLTLNSGMSLYVTGSTTNNGTLKVNAGGRLDTYTFYGNYVINNGGTVNIRRQVVTGTASVDLIGQEIAVSGSLKFDDHVKAVGKLLLDANSKVSGNGLVQGSMVNGGTLSPGNSPGTFTVDGPFTQTDTGVMEMEVGKDTAGFVHDLVDINQGTEGGSASLSGVLKLLTLAGYAGAMGDSFLLLDAEGGLSGALSLDASGAALLNPGATKWSLLLDGRGQVYARVVDLSSPDVFSVSSSLTGVPEPASLGLLGLGGLALLRRRRNAGPPRA